MRYPFRVLHETTDVSTQLNDAKSLSYTFAYTTGQYLYVGSEMPFNNLWVDVGTANAVTGTPVDLDIWFGNAWVPAVDIIDETKLGTASLAQDGRISWSTDRLKGWDVEQTSVDVTGLSSGPEMYNLYWTRFNWATSLTGSMTLGYVGQKFSVDADLFTLYPDLNNTTLMEAFAAGKTTWDDQHYHSAQEIIRDLKQRQIILGAGQILDWGIWQRPAIHKTAEIIYRALGTNYKDNLAQARKDYNEAMSQGYQRVDKNWNGNLDPGESALHTNWLTR